MAQTFFDVSDIAIYIREHRSVSGIQRAAVQIIAQAVQQAPEGTVFLSFYHPVKKSYLPCPASDLIDALETFDTGRLAAAFGVRMQRPQIPPQFLERYQDHPIKQAVHIARMHLAGWRGRARYFERRGLNFQRWQQLYGPRRAAKQVTLRPCKDVAQPGDALCGLGAIWGRGKVLSAFQKASDAGVRVYLLVHDLIPMKLPEMADPRAARSYHQWWYGQPPCP